MTYLGLSVRVWLGWAVLSVALTVAALGSGLIPSPDSGRLLAECARTNGAALTVAECSEYLEWLEATADCRALEEQSDWANCVEAVEGGWECGYVLEGGVWLEAGCSTVEELEERLSSIRDSRSGHRDWEEGL